MSAGGAVQQGETPLIGALRELREETGLKVKDIKELKRIVHDGYHVLFVDYLCVTDCEKDSIILQEGETVDYKWIGRSDLLKMSENELASKRAIKLIGELGI